MRCNMSNLNDSINQLSNDLYDCGMIDKKTLRNWTITDESSLCEYTGEEIKEIREREKVSQAVFAKFLNVSPSMVKSLEYGNRKAQGAILKLLNMIDKHGLKYIL